MRLHAVRRGTVFASDGRDVLVGGGGGPFDRVGRLPPPDATRGGLTARVLTSRLWGPVVDRVVGATSAVNLWPLSETDILATVGPRLLVSGDAGRTWMVTRRLPASSGPMGVLPSAVEHLDGTTYLGEYPLRDGATPRVLTSRDAGRSWSVLTSLPAVRHVHAVQRDPHSGSLWLTTGDTDAESRIGRLLNGAFKAVGGGTQEWRAVELAFTPSAILWGMDCSYADENHLFRLPRDEIDSPDPTPEPVGRAPGSVYYSVTLTVGGTTWVVFSTAMEAGRDSTGPATQADPHDRGVVLAASSESGYTEWHEIASFRRRRALTDLLPGGLPRANGYVFLATDQEQGVYLNPYNTAVDGGEIRRVGPDRIARHNDRRRGG